MITSEYLQRKADEALEKSLSSPQECWTFMLQVEEAVRFEGNPFLAAQAAFQLGRLANEYGRPTLAHQPLDRAENLFARLNEPGWLAAVTWQRHALPWAAADLTLAVQELEWAVTILQSSQSPLIAFAPLCRLTLAYARLLKGDFDNLSELLQQCLDHFANTNDLVHLARTHFVRSSYLRRTGQYPEAKAASFQGQTLAETAGAQADIGRFHCQIGFNHWLCDGDYEAAIISFQQGIHLFESLDIPGWLAQCQAGLALMYLMNGRLTEAGSLLHSAVTQFQEEEIYGQLPPALLDLGWLEMLRGNYQASLDYLNQSKNAYRSVGNASMVPVVEMHLGDTLLQIGRFQQSLQYLEKAYFHFEALKLPDRLAECGLRLANLWIQLNNPKQTRQILRQVKDNAEKANHPSALLAYYFRTAEQHGEQGEMGQAIHALNNALQLAVQQQNTSLINGAQRHLIKIFARQNRLEKAVEQLKLAEAGFEEIELPHEKAAFLLIWGDIYHRQNQPEQAAEAWLEAEKLTKAWMPDLNWQAAAALAGLAEEKGDRLQALAYYQQMAASLRLLRQGFWQPELAGNYLKRPSQALNKAVFLAAQCGLPQETLAYIEESKAQTTARHIQAQTLLQEFNIIPSEIQEMMSEIRWFQKKIRETSQWPQTLFRSGDYENKYRQLLEKIDNYTAALNRHQRQQMNTSKLPPNDVFDLDTFRRQAQHQLGDKWMALDYYQDGLNLVCLALTPTNETAYSLQLPNELKGTLSDLDTFHQRGAAPLLVMRDAGEHLLPTAVRRHLLQNKDTTLLVAPHRDLHHIPWSGLDLSGEAYIPLVAASQPVIISSLQTLCLLWQRKDQLFDDPGGLILAVSDFQDRYTRLPAIMEEVEELKTIFGQRSLTLVNQQATSSTLLAEMNGNGAHHDFWHIATHAFHDEHSGRLSGIALYDRDLWLDELWQLAPLPALVTFSACGGSRSYLIEGDEHVGLTTTCLTAGANHVVGSIWDVPDKGMSNIMTRFYSRLLGSKEKKAVPVSKALADAQRLAWEKGESWGQWAGFRCTGRP